MGTIANSNGRAASRQYQTILIWSALLLAAALAWAVTLDDAREMGNMSGTMGMQPAGFIIMWTIMMAAMMLPSLASVASMYLRIITRQSGAGIRVFRITAFVTGYLLAWAVFGVIAYGVAWCITQLTDKSPETLHWIAAMVLLLCGIYQFTPIKDVCLNHCRSPLGFLFHFGNYRGMLRDLKVGFYHGGYCSGCCIGLMLIMIFAGVMNIVWMVALAVIIFVEKIWHYGGEFSRVVGLFLIILGCALPWYPHILQGI
jgi:predicted metal-binding membrane protein